MVRSRAEWHAHPQGAAVAFNRWYATQAGHRQVERRLRRHRRPVDEQQSRLAVRIADEFLPQEQTHVAVVGALVADAVVVAVVRPFDLADHVPAGGGAPRNLTPGMKASASWIAWPASGKILAVEVADGQSAIATVDPASGVQLRSKIDQSVESSLSVARSRSSCSLMRRLRACCGVPSCLFRESQWNSSTTAVPRCRIDPYRGTPYHMDDLPVYCRSGGKRR